jgi:hypothetical protein
MPLLDEMLIEQKTNVHALPWLNNEKMYLRAL